MKAKIQHIIIALTLFAGLQHTAAAPVMTAFKPIHNGFNFDNNFLNDAIPALDIKTTGLCGGMSYTALDYYFNHMAIPTQPFRPANRTALQSWLYNRDVDAIKNDLDKWGEMGLNPFGSRNSEFFHWGISAKKGERIDELKSFIDRGVPVVLGLQGDGSTGNHEVIAIGYDMGQYKGDLGAHVEDFKIFVCDPNHARETRTLIADTSKQLFTYQEDSSFTWRTYFVDKNYHAKVPPVPPCYNYPKDNLAHALVLCFKTGGDDLRGGNDNIDLTVNLFDGTQQTYPNINLGARWVNNDEEWAEVVLKRPLKPDQFKSVVISDTFTGGIGGDNWNMDSVSVRVFGDVPFKIIAEAQNKRFTGDDKTLTLKINDVPTPAGFVNRLEFTFKTGGDDLRGVNDNVNAVIRFRDGHDQSAPNLNAGHRWADNSTSEVTVDLNRAVLASDLAQVDLQTTFSGGIGGDNWNMDSVVVRALGNKVNKIIVQARNKRFTGDDKCLSLPIR